MGLTEEEYEHLSNDERSKIISQLTNKYKEAGAAYVIKNMKELCPLITYLESK